MAIVDNVYKRYEKNMKFTRNSINKKVVSTKK